MTERRNTTRTILWDLDGTVGDFRGMRISNPEIAPPILLRYGIHELLNEFSNQNGYSHYITSAAGPGYINEALNRAHLNNKFSRTFGKEIVNQTDQGKHYKSVAAGVSEEQIQASMIVIGDSSVDKPVDIGGLVFVELGTHETPHEALVIREIITTILDKGDGNFKAGYENLYNEAAELPNQESSGRRHIDIGNDIAFDMEFRIAEEVVDKEKQKVPVVFNIQADTHTKPFQPFF